MYFFVGALILSCIIICFSLYVLIREDVIFIRRNISVDQVFNSVFVGIPASLFAARFFFVLTNLKFSYFNPFVFFLFPYYPGLSLLGGVAGALLFEFFYTKPKKIPSERLTDFLSISFLWGITMGRLILIGQTLIGHKPLLLYDIVAFALHVGFALLFSTTILSMIRRGELKEGSATLLFLATFGFLTFFGELLSKNKGLVLVFDIEGVVSVVIFLVFLVLFLQREQIALRIRK